ncbi:MAG: hypothetical protein ACI9E1_002101 [Cryomorphaceae bacterium]|jgi:hypothetical protein
MSNTEERDLGTQPLDAILTGWQLDNHDVVEASPEQLTHKQLVRARNGRRLTLKMMTKVSRTVNFSVWGRLTDEEREQFTEYSPKQLFTYSKGSDAAYIDPNKALYEVIADREIRADFRTELGI